MTPQLQQAFRLLRLPASELQAQVQQALETNVMLETDPEFDATWVLDGTSDAGPTDRELEQPHDSRGTLRDHLAWQLELAPLPHGPRAIGRALINAINDDGFLTETTGAIVDQVASEVRADAGVVESVLAIIQQFDPVGVGARSVAECIGLQLAQLEPGTPGLEAAQKIARHHLELAANQQFRDLKRLTACSGPDLEAALALVGGCDRRPGAAFRSLRTEYLVPDVFAQRAPDGWAVELDPAAVPRVRVNERYAAMITGSDDQVALRTQLHQARSLVRSLEIRDGMVLGISRAIVARQEDFLDRRNESVRPVSLRDLAEAVGTHESILARVTTGKYLRTPRGVFEFRFFCSSLVPDAGNREPHGTWLSSAGPQAAAG